MTLVQWLVARARKTLQRGESLSNTQVRELYNLNVDVVALEREYKQEAKA